MESRNKIIKNIKQSIGNKNITLNDLKIDLKQEQIDWFENFKESLQSVSADVHLLNNIREAKTIISKLNIENRSIINLIPDIDIEGKDPDSIDDPKDFYPLDITIMQGKFGVAENGAIWTIPGNYRILPFICETLIVVLNRNDIVPDMHEAYRKLQNDEYDYGVFIAGPSKTADIEQTLVIGAQGTSKMLVLILND